MADIVITFNDGTTEEVHIPGEGEITDTNLVDIAADYCGKSLDDVVDAVVTNN